MSVTGEPEVTRGKRQVVIRSKRVDALDINGLLAR